MKSISRYISVLALILFVQLMTYTSCVEPIHPYTQVAPGTWRGVLYIDPNQSVAPGIEVRKHQKLKMHSVNDIGQLPFLFEVDYTDDTTMNITILNGEERIDVLDIEYGRTKSSSNEKLVFHFDAYDGFVEAIVKEDVMQGHFVIPSKNNYRIPFAAFYGSDNRFLVDVKPRKPMNFGGTWEVTFNPDTDDSYPAIGEFQQDGNSISGTFLTETGDYRYLDGLVDSNKIWMSVFDGSHAFLFHAKMQEDSSLQGIFKSGKHYESIWTARRNANVTLINPDSLSKAMSETFSLELKEANGKNMNIPDDLGDGIKIIQIMGTWCPNCRDEMIFLRDFQKNNPDLNISIASLAFERSADEKEVLAGLSRYKQKMDIDWPILWGGRSSKSEASEKLPMIDKVISYPTMIFLDKSNKIRRVHTGFNGPATSVFEEFETDFEQYVKTLVAE